MKTSWYLYRKINFKLLINNQLGLAWIANISKMLGYFFRSALGPQPNISTLSILVFLLQQRFAFTLHVSYCCVIRAYSSDFNPSSYLQLWIGSVHQSYTAGAFLCRACLFRRWCLHITWTHSFQNLSYSQYGWAVITKIVHQLKLLQLSIFDDRNPTMARVIAIYQKSMTT